MLHVLEMKNFRSKKKFSTHKIFNLGGKGKCNQISANRVWQCYEQVTTKDDGLQLLLASSTLEVLLHTGSYLLVHIVAASAGSSSVRHPNMPQWIQSMGALNMLFSSAHSAARTWMYSVRELKICFVTARALEKLCCPDSSMMSFPE